MGAERLGTKRDRAGEWLKAHLARGPASATTIREDALEAGLSWATIRRAADDVGVEKKRRGWGKGSEVYWQLPGERKRPAGGRPRPIKLAGLAEVAALLRVSKFTAHRYSRRRDFPPPLDRLAAGPVWRRVDVERWAKEHLPLATGRPRKRGSE